MSDLAIAIWDMYKDIHGIRPRWMPLNTMSEEALQAEYDRLCRDYDHMLIEEAAREENAIKAFEQLVVNTIANGAGDRENAIRWIKDANDWGNDMDGLCWEFGLPYGYFNKKA